MFDVAASVNVNIMAWPLVRSSSKLMELFYSAFKDLNATAASSETIMGVIELECMMEGIMELSASSTLAMKWEE